MYSHPLDPLSPQEIERGAFNKEAQSSPPCPHLWEPSKPAIREYEKTRIPPPREARVEILTEKEIVCWGICSLTSASFTEWNEHPKREGQPAFQIDEHAAIEELVKRDVRVQNAARKRGVVDPESQLMVDCGSAGNFNLSYLSSFQYLIY